MKKILLIALVGLVVGLGLAYTGQVQAWLEQVGVNVSTVAPAEADQSEEIISPIATAPSITGDSESVTSPAPSPKPLALPSRLVIEKINIDASVEHVGLDAQQRMDVPKQDENVGWYQYGATPGEVGSAVLAGHFDSRAGTPAVFYELTELEVGDEIKVYDEVGQVKTFVVTNTKLYPDSQFPIDQVFGQSDSRTLNLITCAGVFDQKAKNYQDRLVVTSVLKEEVASTLQ